MILAIDHGLSPEVPEGRGDTAWKEALLCPSSHPCFPKHAHPFKMSGPLLSPSLWGLHLCPDIFETPSLPSCLPLPEVLPPLKLGLTWKAITPARPLASLWGALTPLGPWSRPHLGGTLRAGQVNHEQAALPHLLEDVLDPAALTYCHLEHCMGAGRRLIGSCGFLCPLPVPLHQQLHNLGRKDGGDGRGPCREEPELGGGGLTYELPGWAKGPGHSPWTGVSV